MPNSSAMLMTPWLLAARAGIIIWLTIALIPVEILFDAIEDEIERRVA
jgi:hypothetical protein